MSTVRTRATENTERIVTLLILGAGFVALFAGFDYFFLIWILGFAVFLPLVAILTNDGEDELTTEKTTDETSPPAERSSTDGRSTPDALATLRERYARGELTDDQFKRKLDALLETESPESAVEWRTRERV